MMRCTSWIVIALVVGTLQACGDDKAAKATPSTQTVKKIESVQPTNTPVPVAVAVAPYVYSYNPLGKRDPFRSPRDERTRPNDVGDCTDALCGFDIAQLTLVGVVTGDANPMGMVLDPDGRGHILKRNMRVGKQGGRVTQILRDSITVTQLWTAPDGKVTPNPILLKLKPDKTVEPVMDLLSRKFINK